MKQEQAPLPTQAPEPPNKTHIYRNWKHIFPGAIALAGNAGYVNAVVLGFFDTPVSHMSGAVSRMSFHIVERHTVAAFEGLLIILGFLVGGILAGCLIGSIQLTPSRRYGGVIMLEGALLLLATFLLYEKSAVGLALASLACGLQNGMSTTYCGIATRTTHITGIVTDLGMMLGHWIRRHPVDKWKLNFLSSVLFAFGIGGIVGTVANLLYGPICLLLSAFGCLIAGAIFYAVMHAQTSVAKQTTLRTVSPQPE